MESPRAGVREVKVLARSSAVAPPQTPGRVKKRELLLLLAAAVAALGDGAHVAETPETPDPKALAYLKAAAHSMLLPRSCAASTLLMVFHGSAWGTCRHLQGAGGACKGSWGGSEIFH